jgi:nicotinate-nucleotide pyrophosphorylase (carboxylating)
LTSQIDTAAIHEIVARALNEDVGSGDVTTEWTIPPNLRLQAQFVVKADGVIAGLAVAPIVFQQIDPRVQFEALVPDGAQVTLGRLVARVDGPGRAVLSGERTALNLMQRMSGIATITRQYAEAIAGTRAIILDTRKTAPGLRLLDKWAVRLGGGQNHRTGLYDMVLIKDNHIAAAGGITAAVRRVREMSTRPLAIEVEVRNVAELDEALALHLDRIMLDNMSTGQMRDAVRRVAGRTPLEASGNVSLDTVAAIAATGVDFISVGQLTHSVKALDISMKVTAEGSN